jgi:hypothetical protein
MMNRLLPNNGRRTRQPGAGEQAGAQIVLLFAVFFLLGVAVSAFLFYSFSARNPAATPGQPAGALAIQLSDSTRAVLSRLDSPLEIRFYTLLDPTMVPDAVTSFASRVDQLLSAYQQHAGDKIKVIRFTPQSNLNPNAAAADGIHAFNLDKGEPSYLGLALTFKGRKELLPRLLPEWEQAVEPDLTRAIARLLDAAQPVPAPVSVSQVNTNAIQEVRALIPDLSAVSVEEGNRLIQEAALKDFAAAAKEMQVQVKEAEKLLGQAQNSGSEADRQAAMKTLHQVQAEQNKKLKQIAAKAKAQTEALEQLKAAAR